MISLFFIDDRSLHMLQEQCHICYKSFSVQRMQLSVVIEPWKKKKSHLYPMAALLASKTKATKELVSPFRQTKKIKHANWCRSGSSRRQELCFFWCVDCLLSKRWSGQKIFEIESPRLPPIKSSLEPSVFTTCHHEEFDSSLWQTPLMFMMSSGLPWTQQGKWTSTWL